MISKAATDILISLFYWSLINAIVLRKAWHFISVTNYA